MAHQTARIDEIAIKLQLFFCFMVCTFNSFHVNRMTYMLLHIPLNEIFFTLWCLFPCVKCVFLVACVFFFAVSVVCLEFVLDL